MRWLVLTATLAACASSRWVVVRVAAPDGPGLAGATVSAVCPPRGQGAKVTGVDGIAALELPEGERCVVTAARPGLATQQTTVAACPRRAGCATTELTLEPE